MVMAWRLRRYARGTNGSNISSFEFSAIMQLQHSFLPLISTDDTLELPESPKLPKIAKSERQNLNTDKR
jgi:hypothetical protein